MKKFVLLAIVAMFSSHLMAQDSKIDIFGGYQYLHNGDVKVGGATEPDSSQRGDREDYRRNADVVWFLMVPLQEVCGHDQPFITRHRSQR